MTGHQGRQDKRVQQTYQTFRSGCIDIAYSWQAVFTFNTHLMISANKYIYW